MTTPTSVHGRSACGSLVSRVIAIPKSGAVGRLFNPHPFNMKEHAAMVVIALSAAQTALAVEVIAAQRLFYDAAPNVILSILIVISSQCLGYGFAGLLRRVLVYPRPSLLPMNTLLETLHRDRRETRYRLRFFWLVLVAIFFWELLPEYTMPLLTGISVFCLAKQDSLVITNVFGGSNGNEGLGLLSLGLDWQFISSKPLWTPLATLTNSLFGYIICMFFTSTSTTPTSGGPKTSRSYPNCCSPEIQPARNTWSTTRRKSSTRRTDSYPLRSRRREPLFSRVPMPCSSSQQTSPRQQR